MTTWHSSLTKVGGLFSFWEARKKSTLGMAGDWEAAVRGAGWGQRYSTDSTWRDNQLGQKCKQNSSLGSKSEKCNIPITKTPEFHFSRVSSLSHANKRSSYPTKNLKIANCEPIKLIIIYYFHYHLHHQEKNFNQDYSPPTPPWETQPTFLALVRGNHRTRLKNQWTIFLKCAFTTYMHTLYFLSLRLCVNISV